MPTPAGDPTHLHPPIMLARKAHLCRYCGGNKIRRSKRRPAERLLSLLGLYPYRCTKCSHRFFALGRHQQHVAGGENNAS